MKVLNLSYNSVKNIGAINLSDCIHKIDELQLYRCDITEEGVIVLAEQIKKRDTPVYLLY